MTSQSQGIQQLLQAEKRAKDKLEEAKKSEHKKRWQWASPKTKQTRKKLGKGKRLKQAKEEAIAEIDHYRLQREKDFRWKHSKIMGSHDNLSTKIDEDTAAKIQGLTNNYYKNRENVLGYLLGKVYDINPDIHPNYTYTI